ncbi:uncharacterized protein B0T15DRAFT_233603 [Chaetomium strumarium]|uniref:Secreted protein n=1 Tax=Chaetomium strumarium TaxID=1170767 RepID=A0AAJ0M097_9PEZI|nr:hypothetical protein B0T15DRAFT_233603 [Chaetomium strumarium]
MLRIHRHRPRIFGRPLLSAPAFAWLLQHAVLLPSGRSQTERAYRRCSMRTRLPGQLRTMPRILWHIGRPAGSRKFRAPTFVVTSALDERRCLGMRLASGRLFTCLLRPRLGSGD